MGAHPLLTPAAATERLGMDVAELTALIEAGKGPAHIKIRRMVRFLDRDLQEWAEEAAWICADCHAAPGDECDTECSNHTSQHESE